MKNKALNAKAAFAHWDKRIAPVFDTARQIHVINVESGKIIREAQEMLLGDFPVQKTLRLVELGIETLVCGAISRTLHTVVASYGIRVIPFVAGDLQEVVQAWLTGSLEHDTFAMPGCCGWGGWRFRGMHNNYQERQIMNGRGRGMGAGDGKGRGQGGGSRGRMGGRKAGGPTGYCICPQCGQTELHQRGTPCTQQKCPKCGAFMTRQ